MFMWLFNVIIWVAVCFYVLVNVYHLVLETPSTGYFMEIHRKFVIKF